MRPLFLFDRLPLRLDHVDRARQLGPLATQLAGIDSHGPAARENSRHRMLNLTKPAFHPGT
jgi:hypothetical protein